MENFVMPETIAFNKIGKTNVSTVKLNSASLAPNKYETCIFYESGDSNVVETYDTYEDAVKGHLAYVAIEYGLRDFYQGSKI